MNRIGDIFTDLVYKMENVGSRKNKKGGKQEYLKKKHVKTHKTQGSL
jgi:hypothetical protein